MKKKFELGQILFVNYLLPTIHLSRMEPSEGRRLLTTKWKRLFQVVILITLITLGKAVDEMACSDDSECSPEQYCYKVSSNCVNYTICSRYKRLEGDTKAQNPSQCGPCRPGYFAEVLGTGENAPYCVKDNGNDNGLKEMFQDDEKLTPWIYAVIVLAVLLITTIAYCLKKKIKKHDGDDRWFHKVGTWSLSPSAPPPDSGAYHLQRPYYAEEKPPIYSSVINNNNNVQDRNRLVNAVPFAAPDWVRIDPNYNQDDPDAAVETPNVSTTFHVEDEETTPSSWTPEQVTVPVPTRPFHQFAPEQRDNVLNTVLVRGDCSSTSDTESNNGPAPGSSRNSGENYRGPSVQINQMITLNMVKSDN